MAVFVAVGVMNLAFMAALAVVIFGEKLLPDRATRVLTRALGILLLGFAVLAAAHPAPLPGLHLPGAHPVGGMGGIKM